MVTNSEVEGLDRRFLFLRVRIRGLVLFPACALFTDVICGVVRVTWFG